jgi:uncharacterized glyoxalase superfamily protein PhnB
MAKPIPTGFHTVTPYLVCKRVPQLLEFLNSAFGAVERERMVDETGRVMHAEVQIGDSMIMMGEATENYPPRPATIYLYVLDVDAVYRRAIKAGGKSQMEPANQFYGDRNAGVVDPFGNQWWIGTHIEDVPAEELARRSRERR